MKYEFNESETHEQSPPPPGQKAMTNIHPGWFNL